MVQGESGGSEPHLFDTDLGLYMVKVRNNPQGVRVLVNELVGGLCLDWLGVTHPAPAVVDVPQELIDMSPDAKFNNGRPLEAGLAFGSVYWQSDPGGTIDPTMLANLFDVAGNAVFGTWVAQFDGRQYRVRASKHAGKYDYVPVDQGFSFGSPDWSRESLLTHQLQAADVPVSLTRANIVPFVELLRSFSGADAIHIVDQVPAEWLSADLREPLTRYLVERAPLAAKFIVEAYAEV